MSYSGPRLRPMTAGDIVDEAISLYRRHFKIFMIVGAVVIVPLSVLQIFLNLIGDGTDLAFVAVSGLITTVLSFFVYIILWAAMARTSASLFLAEPMDERSAFRSVFDRIGPVLLLAFLYGMTVTLLTFVFFIGVFFAIAWIFAMHVLLVERLGITAAISRSQALVKGHWWRVFGIMLIAAIVQGVIVIAFSIPSMVSGGGTMVADPFAETSQLTYLLATIGNAAGVIVAGPIIFCTVTLLYFDLRMRKEGFDLEYQVREMEAALAPPPAGPSF